MPRRRPSSHGKEARKRSTAARNPDTTKEARGQIAPECTDSGDPCQVEDLRSDLEDPGSKKGRLDAPCGGSRVAYGPPRCRGWRVAADQASGAMTGRRLLRTQPGSVHSMETLTAITSLRDSSKRGSGSVEPSGTSTRPDVSRFALHGAPQPPGRRKTSPRGLAGSRRSGPEGGVPWPAR